jgi:hypothetical protein
MIRNLLLVTLFGLPIVVNPAYAEPLDKTVLVGAWDYNSYTMLQKGKPAGTIQFKPRTMVFTYRDDGTWTMEAADATHTRLSGTYEVGGSELVLKKSDGSTYQDWQVEVRQNGAGLVLKDKASIITASKMSAGEQPEPAPTSSPN